MKSSNCNSWFGKLATLVMAFVISGVVAFAQTKTVTGTVTDATGEPIIGANVVVTGTSNGATTDIDGNFSIANVANNATLQVSFIGYATQTVSVAGKAKVQITLEEDSETLDDVVVIGYQTVRRKDLTGSVASVNAKNLTATPVSNVAQALQGKLPGVNIVSQDGRPDAAVNIRVRGGGSVSQSNEPLVLIDGVVGTLSDVPSDQVESIDVLKDASSTAIYGARGANGVILVTTKGAKEGKTTVSYHGFLKLNTPTGYVDAMNPYDYLSYVWANAAANDGWDGTGDFAAGGYVTPFIKLYGLGQYGNIENYRNVGMSDIQKEIYDNSWSHSHDLTISGGTEKTRILLNFNYVDEEGMKINSYNRRANFSVKVDQKINKRLKVNLDARYTENRSMSDESTTSGSGSILSYAYRFRPISLAAIEKYGNPDAFFEGMVEHNGKESMWENHSPYARIQDYLPKKTRETLRATGGATWNIFDFLTYRSELSMSRSWNQNKIWGGAIYNNYVDDKTGEVLYAGSADLYKGDSWSTRWTNTLNYSQEFNKIHRVNVLLGHEVSDTHGSSMRMRADHYPSNFTAENAFAMINQYSEKNSVTQPMSSGVVTPERIISYFGRVNYTLMDRYLFTFTFRADGSSKFTPNKRWGYFPAAAFAWRAKEESFLKNVDWLSDAKVRLSYGEVGNDGIDATQWQQYWGAASDKEYYTINGQTMPTYTLSSTQMANPDLKWETTISRNVGLDFGFLDGRINGTVDAYWNTTKDLLMLTTLPGITGFTSTFANIGQTSNRGIEVSLNGTIFRNKDWNVTAGFNINFNKNKVDELAPGVTGIYGTSWFSSGNPSNDFILEEGEAVGRVRGLKYVGMYTTDDFTYDPVSNKYTLKEGVPDVSASITGVMHGLDKNVPAGQNAFPGMAKYQDTDDSGTVDSSDYTVIGDMNPLHTGGFNVSVNYKNWDLAAYFNWSYGNEIYNINRMASMMGYKETGVYQNHMAFMKDCYKIYDVVNNKLVRYNTPDELNKLNANAKYPLCYNESGVVSNLGIEDGSYLRLGTLTLGYTLPKSVLNTLHLSNLRVYASAYNLLTFTDYSGLDPEVSTNGNLNNATYPTPNVDWGAYPRARSFVFGINVGF